MQPFIPFLSGLFLSQTISFFPFSTLIILTGLILVFALTSPSNKSKLFLIILMLSGLLYGLIRSERPLRLDRFEERPMLIKYHVGERSSYQGPWKRVYLYKGIIEKAFNIDTNLHDRSSVISHHIQELKGKEAIIRSDMELSEDRLYTLFVKIKGDRNRMNPGYFRGNSIELQLLDTGHIEDKATYLPGSFSRPEGSSEITGWIKKKRSELSHYLTNNFRNGGFLSSIITGVMSGLTEEVRDSFNRSGLAHILSISGTHFGLLSTFVFFVMRSSISILPWYLLRRLTLYLTPSQLAAIFSLPFLILYLLISGASIPAIRSFIMINIFLLGLLINRRGYWLNSLLFAGTLILLWDPLSIKEISFQLSFLAVLFLGYSIEMIEKGVDLEVRPLKVLSIKGFSTSLPLILEALVRAIGKAFFTSLFICLGTAPLVAYYFHYLSLIAPGVNIVMTPFICLLLLPMALLSSFIFIFTGYFPFKSLISRLSDLSLNIIEDLSSLSFSAIPIGNFPIAFLILFYGITSAYIVISSLHKPSSRRWVFPLVSGIAVIYLVSFPLFRGKGFSITFLDVGQGDSSVIESPSGKTIVIDTGKTGREVESYIRFRGKDTIDAVVITHADNDHSGGLVRLLKRLQVKEIWDNGRLLYPETIKDFPHRSLERGDIILTEGLRLQVFHPYNGFYSSQGSDSVSGNENSLVIKATGQKISVLFTADIEEEAEEDLLYLGKELKSNVIKISHHGSRRSSSGQFLDAVSPSIAVLSSGRYNPFGHPHEEVIERLEERGIDIYRTDRDGAIMIAETDNGHVIKRYRDLVFERGFRIGSELRNIRRLFSVW